MYFLIANSWNQMLETTPATLATCIRRTQTIPVSTTNATMISTFNERFHWMDYYTAKRTFRIIFCKLHSSICSMRRWHLEFTEVTARMRSWNQTCGQTARKTGKIDFRKAGEPYGQDQTQAQFGDRFFVAAALMWRRSGSACRRQNQHPAEPRRVPRAFGKLSASSLPAKYSPASWGLTKKV